MSQFHDPGRTQHPEGESHEHVPKITLASEAIRIGYLSRPQALLMGEAELRQDLVETLLDVNDRVNSEPDEGFASGMRTQDARKLQALAVFKAVNDRSSKALAAIGMCGLNEDSVPQIFEDSLRTLFETEPVSAVYLATLMTHLISEKQIRMGMSLLREFESQIALVRAVNMTAEHELSKTRCVGLETLVDMNRHMAASVCGDILGDDDPVVARRANQIMALLDDGDSVYDLHYKPAELVPLAKTVVDSCAKVAKVWMNPEAAARAEMFDDLNSVDFALGTSLEPVILGWMAVTSDRDISHAAISRLGQFDSGFRDAVAKSARHKVG